MELNEISVATSSIDNILLELLNMRDLHIHEDGQQESQNGKLPIPAEGPLASTNLKNDNKHTVEEGLTESQDGMLTMPAEGPFASPDLQNDNKHTVEEGLTECPLCKQDLKLYFINLNEKIVMCVNLQCYYPFGYKSIKIIREENGVQIVEVKSIPAKGSRSTACSQSSSQAWSEVEKICSGFESDDISSLYFNKSKTNPIFKNLEPNRRKKELLDNVEKIKEMTNNMSDTNVPCRRIIKNEKWIKTLQYLQGLSGRNLLNPAEMKKIRKKVAPPRLREIKIDIDKNNLANIKIELNRTNVPKNDII